MCLQEAAWGRPALPGCTTNAVSSATTFLIGCPPLAGSAVGSVFEGCPARVLACTLLKGADNRETLMFVVGGPDRRCRLGRRFSGHGVNLFGIESAKGVIAAPGQLSGGRDGGQLPVVVFLDGLVVVVHRAGSP